MSRWLPWMLPVAQRLVAQRESLPHALLIHGSRGIGKSEFVASLAQALLCEAPSGDHACGHCHSCLLYSAGSHPDLHVLQPDAVTRREESLLSRFAARYLADSEEKKTKPSAVIAVDQVRELIIAAQGRPQIARCRVMVLAPAESLNHNAANSLLKLLEEPPADTHLLLVSHEPERLLPTIRSRCSRVVLPLPSRSEATTWLASAGLPADRVEPLLALAGGAPFLAVNYFKDGFLELRSGLARDLSALAAGEGDPVSMAGQWKSHGALRCLGWLQTWLHDLAVLAGAGGGSLYNPDQLARLQTLLKALNLVRLFRYSDTVAEATRQAEGPLDEQLLLEDVLIRWTRLCSER